MESARRISKHRWFFYCIQPNRDIIYDMVGHSIEYEEQRIDLCTSSELCICPCCSRSLSRNKFIQHNTPTYGSQPRHTLSSASTRCTGKTINGPFFLSLTLFSPRLQPHRPSPHPYIYTHAFPLVNAKGTESLISYWFFIHVSFFMLFTFFFLFGAGIIFLILKNFQSENYKKKKKSWNLYF